MRRPSPPGAGKPGREVRASCRKGLTRVHVLPGHSPGAGLLLDGVAETRQNVADFAARHAEPLLDRALGALEGTLPFHLLVAGEDPDCLLHLPLGLLRFSADFLLSHGILLFVLSVRGIRTRYAIAETSPATLTSTSAVPQAHILGVFSSALGSGALPVF